MNEEQLVQDAIDHLDEDFLAHYGTKGMKWGVRKERETSGRRRSSHTVYGSKRKGSVLSSSQRARLKKLASRTVKGLKNKKAEVSVALKERTDKRINKQIMKSGTVNKRDIGNLSEKELDEKIRLLEKQKKLASLSQTKRQQVVESFKNALAKSASDAVTALVKDAGEKAIKKALASVNQNRDYDADLLNKPTSNMSYEELQKLSKRVDVLNKVENYRKQKAKEEASATKAKEKAAEEAKKAQEGAEKAKAEAAKNAKEEAKKAKAEAKKAKAEKKAKSEQERADREVELGRKIGKVKSDFEKASNERKAKIVAKELSKAIDSFGKEPVYQPKHSSGKTATQAKFESAVRNGKNLVKNFLEAADAATEPYQVKGMHWQPRNQLV